MRIISGRFRSRSIKAPRGRAFRPTTDRVRESLFNVLGEKTQNAKVLDLYAGSGSLGLEALSRGAAEALFIDDSRSSTDAVLKNLEDLELESKSRVVNGDALHELRAMAKNGFIFDLIFLDPPYSINVIELREVFQELTKCLGPSGLIVFESGAELSEAPVESLRVIDKRKYGITRVYFFKKKTEVSSAS